MFQNIYTLLLSIFSNILTPGGLLVTANIFLALATAMLVIATMKLKKTADMQFLGSMVVAFQNEWHNKKEWLMRSYLHSDEFKEIFNNAITAIYNQKIDYTDIKKISNTNNLVEDIQNNVVRNKLRKDFNKILKASVQGQTFTPYEALNLVMLSIDRLVFLKENEFIFNNFIIKYKQPLLNLKPILKAYITIESHLRPEKGFKEELLSLLFMLAQQ